MVQNEPRNGDGKRGGITYYYGSLRAELDQGIQRLVAHGSRS